MLQVHSRVVAPAQPPLLFIQLHPASQYHQYIHKVRVGWKEVGAGWRGENAQQAEERKGKMRRGGGGLLKLWLKSFVGLIESVQLPEWLKLSLFNVKTEWIFSHFCDIKLRS